MRIVFVMLMLTAAVAVHAACDLLPKPNMNVNEVLVATVPNAATGRPSLVAAWPTTNPDRICCNRIQFSAGYWADMLGQQIPLGMSPAPLWLAALPQRDDPITPEEQAMCQQMANAIIVVPRVVRNSSRTDGARPLYVLRDPSQPLSSANPLVPLKVANVQQYVESGQPCERTPVINTTSAGQWLYTTSLSNQRGIALCK